MPVNICRFRLLPPVDKLSNDDLISIETSCISKNMHALL